MSHDPIVIHLGEFSEVFRSEVVRVQASHEVLFNNNLTLIFVVSSFFAATGGTIRYRSLILQSSDQYGDLFFS